MRFYLVRHGKTEFNLARRFQGGAVDSPLLPESIINAQKVGSYLADLKFAGAFASPQERAVVTAQNIVDQWEVAPKIKKIAALREMNFGKWDGDLVAAHQGEELFEQFLKYPSQFEGEKLGGENYYQFTHRVQAGLKSIFEEGFKAEENVLVAAHALVISFAVKSLLGKSFEEIRAAGLVANTSVTVLETNDFNEFKLLDWNNTNFLIWF